MSAAEITRRPALRSALFAAAVGAVVPIAMLPAGGSPAVAATAGVTTLTLGVALARRRLIDVGALLAFVAVVFAGLNDAGIGPVLAGTVGSVAAWDAGENAVSLGEQLGREADTVRVERLHALAGVAVGVAAAALGVALYAVGPTHQPVTTLFVLLIAAALLVVALNR